MGISISFSGQDKLVALGTELAGAPARVRAATTKVVSKTAHDIEGTAKQIAPVRTGALRNSITAGMTGVYSAEIGPHVSYAAYVEYGTSRMAPRAYMGPALAAHVGAFETALGEVAAEGVWS